MNVEGLQAAEEIIFKNVQSDAFSDEIKLLKVQSSDSCAISQGLSRKNILYKLDHYVDDHGLLRVGGRLRASALDESEKHPVILPKSCHVTKLVVRHCMRKLIIRVEALH